MNIARVSQLYSDEFQAINQWFHSTHPPYCFHDIHTFNTLYKHAYPALSREEKRRVEEFVDKLIEGVESPNLAPKIFGVV
jgi:hypothetical protein